jgi:hypothetical protein
MNVIIRMVYSTHGSKSSREASFSLRSSKRAVDVAYEWWKEIKKDMSYFAKLEKVILNGEKDITETILRMDHTIVSTDELPF